ncbi:MAG: ribosomal RNA small subunit methyltransferase A [Anaerolineae bacterium]|nr:ribosomal RNA small subunit methyltransferase A [Anaerolineae bacterium]
MSSISRTLRDYGIYGKKWLGQNFLVDPSAVQKIIAAAELTPNDTVLEIGPGPGTLTAQIARRAGRVVAVEVDADVLPALRETLASFENVTLIHGDILEQDIATLISPPYKVIANLPYYITSAVLRHVLETRPRPTTLVITVQREVAQRITAAPGQMSLLGVSVQFYGRPHIVARIPPGAFRPIPKVHSAAVRIDCFDPLPWNNVDKTLFFRVARAGFGQKRKQIKNALAHGLSLPIDVVEEALAQSGINAHRRAETLSMDEWAALSRAFKDVQG